MSHRDYTALADYRYAQALVDVPADRGAALRAFEGVMLSIPETRVGKATEEILPVEHSFAGGLYTRVLTSPPGVLCTTRRHLKEHQFFLLEGEVSTFDEDYSARIKAPFHGTTKAGTKRAVYTHSRTVFVTVHRTDCTTVEDVEREIFEEGDE